MTTKEYLDQPRKLYLKAERLRMKYEELYDRATSPRSTLYTSDNIILRSESDNSQERLLIKMADTKERYCDAILDYVDCMQDVFELVNEIKGAEADVLFYRYILLKPWQEITDNLSCSISGVHKIHRKALLMIEKKLSNIIEETKHNE